MTAPTLKAQRIWRKKGQNEFYDMLPSGHNMTSQLMISQQLRLSHLNNMEPINIVAQVEVPPLAEELLALVRVRESTVLDEMCPLAS